MWFASIAAAKFPYDWLQMKVLASKPRTAWAADPVTIVPGFKAA
ncbi:MAG: hypothetical protein ABSE85_16380 [Candidatus Korobacteraceae bacterium]|jgi:hypothetical protein